MWSYCSDEKTCTDRCAYKILLLQHQTHYTIWITCIWANELLESQSNFPFAEQNNSNDLQDKEICSIRERFREHKILTVHELYVYDLLKFCLRSINKLNSTAFLNDFFTLKTKSAYFTRKSIGIQFEAPCSKTKTKRQSIWLRGCKLLKIFRDNNLLPENVLNLKRGN